MRKGYLISSLVNIAFLIGLILPCPFNGNKAKAASYKSNIQSYEALTTPKIIHPSWIKGNEYKNFDIILNPKQPGKFLHQATSVNTPGSLQFKHYLTANKIGTYYGQPLRILIKWNHYLNQHHLKCSWFKNRMVLKVSGRVRSIDKVFNIRLQKAIYHNNPVRFGTRKNYIPKELSRTVLTIIGITDYNYHNVFSDSFNNSEMKGEKSNRGKSDVKKIMRHYDGEYLYRKGLTGRGTEIGIIAFGAAKKKNVIHFWQHEGASTSQKRLKIREVFSNRFEKTPAGKDDLEATQDAEIAGAIAKRAKVKIFFVPEPYPNIMNFLNAYLTAFDDPKISVTTSSWGLGNQIAYLARHRLVTPHYRYLLNLVLAQGALEGDSNFTAAGDFGIHGELRSTYKNHALLDYQNTGQDPLATNPFVTSVGATVRSFTIKENGYMFRYRGPETAWGFATNIWSNYQKENIYLLLLEK
ncbi:protease pro-enzyme activation domain-containing protein [Lactobacillus helveticus]|uniref:Pro-kumamolisin, activation domain protein n=4 Tax=Bacilli TaxID=91061 RepID=A0A8E1V0I1_LENKE|nr:MULTISPECIES: protease pro-enzyme activation domain-containing protein [Lactobacillaceae]KRL58340.1 Pro-kumamolisin, activation domain protein [Lentilactobacillus parakefiri DSM 10551]KRM51424.1 Pro-kumamolisin, activation domain protein [Lentilactobacillus kefiri DSM 20587 = JCM 5818]MCP9370249.1 hypothetical protein [Lentilactobacillus kefiri]MDH5818494.1 protease pro-enzyme activation domain-containing protein [Lactobacillus helveticus]PAK58389.1 hypothetical protein B9K02_11935 [Lentila